MMIEKFFIVVVMAISLNAAYYNSMVKESGSNNIIDIGVQKQTDAIQTASKIWTEYQATFNLIDGLIRTQHRELSERTACVVDQFSRVGCPLEAEACPKNYEYGPGTPIEIFKTFTKTTKCVMGTTFNALSGRCEAVPQCDAGFVFNPNTLKCEYTEIGYNNQRFVYNGQALYWWWWNLNPYPNSEFVKCLNGTLYWDPDQSKTYYSYWSQRYPGWTTQGYILARNYRGGGVSNGYWYYGSYPSCYGETLTQRDPVCPTGTLVDANGCYSQTECDAGMTKVSPDKCEQHYSYFEFKCDVTDQNAYGNVYTNPNYNNNDCLGACPSGRAEDCQCNTDVSPSDVCRRETFTCPLDVNQLCIDNRENAYQSRPLEEHRVYGDGSAVAGYGQYLNTVKEDNTVSGLRRITTIDNKICFEKGNGDKNCVSVDGCMFTGEIDSAINNLGSIQTSGNAIKGTDINGNDVPGQITSTCGLNGSVGYRGRIKPIISIMLEGDKIKFWNPYSNEGYLGFIEFTHNIAKKDKDDGYRLDIDTPWRMRDDGFNRIETHSHTTYAISEYGMDSNTCREMGTKYNFRVYEDTNGIPIDDRMPFDIAINSTGGFYNTNSYIYKKVVPATCEDSSYSLNMQTGKCEKGGQKSVDFSGSSCTDHMGWMQVSSTTGNPVIQFHNNPPYHNCGYWGINMTNIGLPAGSRVVSQSYKLSSWGGGCATYTNITVSNNQNMVYCPASGGQRPTMTGTLTYSYVSEMDSVCPANTLSRDLTTCTVPLNVNADRKCILAKDDLNPHDFTMAKKAIKDANTTAPDYFCSPLSCDSDKSCQSANCTNDFKGNIISEQMPQPSPSDCTDEKCDANLPYYEWCGKKDGCPAGEVGYQEVDGSCYKVDCPDGGFDPNTGKCFKWKCPDGYTDQGGVCVKN